MPYTTIPTRADGDILYAAHLNLLSDNVEYLYGLVNQTNAGTYAYELGPGDGATETAAKWVIRHKTNTFRYDIRVETGTIDSLTIKYASTVIYNDGADRSNPYTYSGTVDLTSFGFTVGTWYVISVVADGEPGSAINSCRVYDLREV